MHIVFISSSYPRHRTDLAGRFVWEFAEHLGALGHRVHVLAWHDREMQHDLVNRHHSVEYVRYGTRSMETLFYRAGVPENLSQDAWKWALVPGAILAMFSAVCRYVREAREPVDVVVGHWLVPGGLIARLAARKMGIASFIVGHSGGVHMLENLPAVVRTLLVSLLESGNLSVPTEALREKLAQWMDTSAIHILPMGFVPAEGVNHEASGTLASDWLCLGRLVSIKNIALAIASFARAELPDDVCLHIVGDGPERCALEALARELRANVRFHGILIGDTKIRVMKSCGFMLLPSKTLTNGRHEGLPVSLLEGSALGLIALTSNIPGIDAYLARPHKQRLDNSDDVSHWAQAIRALHELSPEERTRWAGQCCEHVRAFAWPEWVLNWDSVLKKSANHF